MTWWGRVLKWPNAVAQNRGWVTQLFALDEADDKLADLREGIESSLLIAQPILKKRIQVVLDLDQLPLFYCRPAELNQVFLNLILNAAHAIPDQGTITITGHDMAEAICV